MDSNIGTVLIEVAQNIFLPALTLVGGWFASAWRSRQKKEKDILDNVVQIMDMQKKYIADQDADNRKTRNMNARLEAKLDKKSEAMRQVFKCAYAASGNDCPIITADSQNEACDGCKYNIEENADS